MSDDPGAAHYLQSSQALLRVRIDDILTDAIHEKALTHLYVVVRATIDHESEQIDYLCDLGWKRSGKQRLCEI